MGKDRIGGVRSDIAGGRGDELLFEFAGLDVVNYGEKGGDPGGIAC